MSANTPAQTVALLGLVMMALGSTAQAQEQGLFADDLAEGLRLRTAVQAGTSYTDNFFFSSDQRKENGSGLLIEPEALLTRVLPRFRFLAGADAKFGIFDLPGSVDDYTDWRARLGSEWQPALRHRFRFVESYENGHDPFGTERTENTPLENRENDQWRRIRTDVEYRWGLPNDRINFELDGFAVNREYSNNRDVTRFLDHQTVNGGLRLIYNVGRKSSLFAATAIQRTHYPETAPGAFDRSSTTVRYLLGASWAATAKTSGDVRLGLVDRNPKDDSREAFRRFDWRANLTWSPRAVRQFNLTTGQSSQESFLNTVDFINHRYVGLEWVERWTPRFESTLSARYVNSAFIGSTRNDDFFTYSASGRYRATQTLSLIALASNGERDSNVDFANYERRYLYLGVRYEQ